jgi:hypothetical protein
MSALANSRAGTMRRRGASEAVQFRLLYGTCFGLFLLAGILQRLMPWKWSSRGARGDQSVFAEARHAAGVCAAYAFICP